MKKAKQSPARLTALILALALLLALTPAALAEGEDSFCLFAATAGKTLIGPVRIGYTEGQTVQEALDDSGYRFERHGTFLDVIEGTEGSFLICYDGGGYDLTVPASGVTAVMITENQSMGEEHLALLKEIADVQDRTDNAARYGAVQTAVSGGIAALRGGNAADAAEYRRALAAAVEEYEALMHGDTCTVTVSARQNGAVLEAPCVTLTDVYGNVTTVTGISAEVIAGTYTVSVSDGGWNRTERTVAVTGSTEVSVELPYGEWFGKIRLLDQQTRQPYACSRDDAAHALAFDVPDTAGQVSPILNAAQGADLPDADGVKLYAVYTGTDGKYYGDSVKSWGSNAASLPALFVQGMDGRTFTLEARYESDGSTMIQSWTASVHRFPTLASLTAVEENTTLPLAFDPLTYEYHVTATAEEISVMAEPFRPSYAVTGTGASAEEVRTVTVSAEGRSTSYTLTVERRQAADVTVAAPAGTSADVFNAAGSEILPADGVYHLIPDETYTCVSTKDTWFHASRSFTAAEGLTVTAAEPDTADALADFALYNGSSASTRKAYEPDRPFSTERHGMSAAVPDAVSLIYAQATPAAGYTVQALYDRQTNNAQTHGTPYAVSIQREVGPSGAAALSSCVTAGGFGQTVTVRLSRADGDVTLYQDYELKLRRALHLRSLALASGETEIPLTDPGGTSVTFDRDVTEYAVTVDRSLTEMTLNGSFISESDATPACGGYYALLGGQQYDSLNGVTVPLDQQLDAETVTLRICHADPDAESAEYTINVRKTDPVEVRFVTQPSDASVFMVSEVTGQRVTPVDGFFRLAPGQRYTYTVTAVGYEGSRVTGYVAPNAAAEVSVTLQAAPENPSLPDYEAWWGSPRVDRYNNGAVDVKTPVTADDAALYWASRVGEGYSSDACGCPIIVNGDLYTYAGTTLYRIDTVSGDILATGAMDHASSFAINAPTYAEGMIFVGLADGTLQAFNAATLEPLWIYHDPLLGQPDCPIVYHDGRIYTGFWNGETALADYVCLTVTDEDPLRPDEEKLASWTYASKGGFYWAGAYASDGYLLLCTDDGSIGYTTGKARVLSLDPRTGETIDRYVMPVAGDVRSGVTFVPGGSGGGRGYFTCKGGYFCRVDVNSDGTFAAGSLKTLKLSDLPAGTGMSTSTPTVYNGRAYVGFSGQSQFTPYSGHGIAVVDLNAWNVAYTVPTQGYPQTSGLLTTAYEAETGSVNVYFFDNYTPGKLRMLTDRPGQTAPSLTTVESWTAAGVTTEYDTAYVLFTPSGEQAQYCICSPIADEYGTLYFKNDSACMMAVGSRIVSLEIAREPDRTMYAPGETFDPAGMKVSAVYANGAVRDVTDYVEWSEQPLTELDTEFQIWFPYVMYSDAGGEAGTRVEEPFAVLELAVGEGVFLPRGVTAEEGEQAVFTVRTSDPACTFLWQVSTDGGANWSDCTDEGSAAASLRVTAKAEMDGWLYRCIVTDSSGTVTVTEGARLTVVRRPAFRSQSLVLSGQIGVNFFLELPEIEGIDYSESYMEFTVGRDQTVMRDGFDPDHMNASRTRYGFTCYVNSIQMADTITAVFHYGRGKTVSKEYSVARYIDFFEQNLGSFSAKSVALIRAIADYGHYSQIYLADVNGWTVGEKYAEMSVHYEEDFDYAGILSEVSGKAFVKALGSAKVEKATYKLHLDSETTVDVYLTPKEGTALTASAKYNGKTYAAVKQGDGRYLVRIPGISAHQLGDMITVEGSAGGAFKVIVSALSYARSVLNSAGSNKAAKDGMSALYRYYAAVLAYRT